MRLQELLNPQHFTALQKVFPDITLTKTEVGYVETDGPLKKMASVRGTIFKYPNKIYLDSVDFKPGTFINPTTIQGLVLCHEIRHLQQMKSFWYRLKSWFWNRVYGYEDRPHEKDAHEKDDILVAQWRNLIKGASNG